MDDQREDEQETIEDTCTCQHPYASHFVTEDAVPCRAVDQDHDRECECDDYESQWHANMTKE